MVVRRGYVGSRNVESGTPGTLEPSSTRGAAKGKGGEASPFLSSKTNAVRRSEMKKEWFYFVFSPAPTQAIIAGATIESSVFKCSY
jgi:hypothetical protein